jgi:hypothetical protein
MEMDGEKRWERDRRRGLRGTVETFLELRVEV